MVSFSELKACKALLQRLENRGTIPSKKTKASFREVRRSMLEMALEYFWLAYAQIDTLRRRESSGVIAFALEICHSI